MKNKLSFSIITVSYNAVQSIEETILSVINQNYNNIQYIIIDGLSNDGTMEIITKYQSKISHIISEPDKGIYDAMNKGMKVADGDFVLFLGADDHLISNTILSEITKYLNTNHDSIWYGNVYRPFRNDLYCGEFNKFKLAVKNIPHQGIFYPKNIYKNKNYEMKYRLFADYHYNISLFSKYSFKYINKTISYFNDTASSATQKDINFEKERKKIISSNLGYLPYYYSFIYHYLRKIVKK